MTKSHASFETQKFANFGRQQNKFHVDVMTWSFFIMHSNWVILGTNDTIITATSYV